MHRHLPDKPFLLHEGGEYHIRYSVEDVLGNRSADTIVEPLFVTDFSEVAATTTLREAARIGQPLQQLNGYQIEAIEIDGRQHDMNLPLPLVADNCLVTLSTVGLDQMHFQVEVKVNLTVNVDWIPPKLGGATFTNSESPSARFKLSSMGHPMTQVSRLKAFLVDGHGESYPTSIESLPKLKAGLVQINCAELTPGTYHVELRSGDKVLKMPNQRFRVI